MTAFAWADRHVRPAWEAIKTRRDASVLTAVVRGKLDWHYQAGTNQDHLQATMEWLCRAQDATPDDGVAAAFDLVANTWYPSYPETTGYIIPTFFDYAFYTGDATYRARAIRMANWLLGLQLGSGAFPGPPWLKPKGEPVVFDTGQIIHGLTRAYEETGDRRFLDSARRAGDWLVAVQDADGSWRRYDMECAHTYNSRSAWALLRIDQIHPQSEYRLAAQKHLDWVMGQQTQDAWFSNASFRPNEGALTHTLAYTIEGLLEAGRLLCDQRLTDAAHRAAQALKDQQGRRRYLPGIFGPGWRSEVSWSCPTGNAQMALVWFRLHEMTGDPGYLQAASTANHRLKQIQSRSARSPGVRGGLAGSYPIYGDYGRYLYLNWAAKFLADSLMAEEQFLSKKRTMAREASAVV